MKKGLLFVALVVLVGGCALDIRTTGFLDRDGGVSALRSGASFAVMANVQARNPLFDREIKGKIERMLAKRGYRIDTQEKADYILSFSYSIIPGLRSDSVVQYGPPQTEIVSMPDGKGGLTTRAVTMPGPLSVIPVTTTEYTKHLTVNVADAQRMRNGQTAPVVWVGETLWVDPSSDFRYDIDYLLVATFTYFGQDTGKQRKVSLDKGNPDVRELRKEAGLLAE